MKLTRKEYTAPAEKAKDFWRGVGLWFGLNILTCLCSWGVNTAQLSMMSADPSNSALRNIDSILFILLGVLPFIVNIGLIVYFAFTRSQIALGMLAGFGIVLALVILLGIFLSITCFQTSGYEAAGPRILAFGVAPLLILLIIVILTIAYLRK